MRNRWDDADVDVVWEVIVVVVVVVAIVVVDGVVVVVVVSSDKSNPLAKQASNSPLRFVIVKVDLEYMLHNLVCNFGCFKRSRRRFDGVFYVCPVS